MRRLGRLCFIHWLVGNTAWGVGVTCCRRVGWTGLGGGNEDGGVFQRRVHRVVIVETWVQTRVDRVVVV